MHAWSNLVPETERKNSGGSKAQKSDDVLAILISLFMKEAFTPLISSHLISSQ